MSASAITTATESAVGEATRKMQRSLTTFFARKGRSAVEVSAPATAKKSVTKKTVPGAKKSVSVKKTAAYLGRSVRQVRRYQADGKMPERRKCGRERRYLRSELEKIKSSLD